MILFAILAAAAAPDASACLSMARNDPAAAEREANLLPLATQPGGIACRAFAQAQQGRYADAAQSFAAAARAALDAALAAGTLTDLQRGEAHLDRARALVAAGDLPAARRDLDEAVVTAGDDPLAWLLSATLARRMNDLPRAKLDIAQALRRSADDASVQLEAGNIAALSNDSDRARAAWAEAARLAPDTPAGRSAAGALAQFAATDTKGKTK